MNIRKQHYLRIRRFLEVTKGLLIILWIILMIISKCLEIF